MVKGKLKKKFRTRLTPTEKQESYIDRVSNPKSIADLELALQDPSTPAHKEMMNRLAAGEEMRDVIWILVQRFLNEEYQASERQKEEIFKNNLAKEYAEQKELRPQYDLQSTLPAKSLFSADEEKLKEKIEDRGRLIVNLGNEIGKLNDEIKQLDAKAAQTTQAWREVTQRQRETMLENIAQDKVQILSSSGKVIDKDDARYQNLLHPHVPDPVKIVSMLSSSYEEHQTKPAAEEKQKAELAEAEPSSDEKPKKAIPPAPPPAPPDFLKHPKNMAQKSCVMEQLLFLANLRDDMDSIKDMLKALDNNPALGAYFPGSQKKVKEAVIALDEPHSQEKDLKERTDIFAKAIDIHSEKRTKQELLRTKSTELDKQEMLQAVDQKSLKAVQDKQEKSMAEKEAPTVKRH